jgi:Ca-activated chloride channel family protein
MNGKTPSLFLLALLMASVATASDQIGNDPRLAYTRVSVTDREGRFITQLKPEAFKIAEDKTPQQIVSLSHEDFPISAAVMLDVRGPAKDALKAAPSSFFMNSRRNPADQLFRMESGDKPLNEAVLQGLNNLIQRSRNLSRAFVLLTDRVDPGMSSFSKVKELLKEQDVQLFVIGFGEQEVLRDLAKTSGGQAFFPTSVVRVAQVFNTIERDLRYQYVIGYRPTNSVQDGKWRKVTVTASVTHPLTKKVTPLIVRTKAGYYAPTVARK